MSRGATRRREEREKKTSSTVKHALRTERFPLLPAAFIKDVNTNIEKERE
jgi:hypothetical protein